MKVLPVYEFESLFPCGGSMVFMEYLSSQTCDLKALQTTWTSSDQRLGPLTAPKSGVQEVPEH